LPSNAHAVDIFRGLNAMGHGDSLNQARSMPDVAFQ
jgi:hypothetical protein